MVFPVVTDTILMCTVASQSAEVELQTMEKRTNESDTKCPVRFDLNETSEADANEVAALEPDSFVKADTVQRCPQICMVSDNLDITSTNITSCLDSSCDSHQQTGNEKRNSSNQICSVGSALEVFSDAGVPRDCNISETCAAESISLILPDGCLNSTAQDASKTKCQDQLCVISGNLDGELRM